MASYKDLFDLHIKYIEYVLAKSHLSHQYLKNISESGSEIENELRILLRSIIPDRFRITHGYVVNAQEKTQEPKLSPQTDIIIVDTLVPHSIFSIDRAGGLEVVPIESVVGIFEVKRTLSEKTLSDGIEQITKIVNSIGVVKTNPKRYLTGGAEISNSPTIHFTGGYHSNPILGILSATHSSEITPSPPSSFSPDIIMNFGGQVWALAKDKKFTVDTCRLADTNYSYGTLRTENQISSAKCVAFGLGYILTYLQMTCGRQAPAENYFLNDTII